MKKQKALEDMTHQDLIEALIFDENIQDNLYVANDYAPDKHGNSLITIGFEEPGTKKKRGLAGFILFSFNPKGRMINLEVAVRKGGKEWEIASSGKLVDFAARFGDNLLNAAISGKKQGN
jgi:hypothetical protein